MQIPWIHLHGAVTHFPIALILTALAFELASLIWKKPDFRTVSFWLVGIAALSSIPAVITGLLSAGQVFAGHPPALLADHRLAGYATAILSILAFLIRWAQGSNANSPAAIRASLVFLLLACGSASYAGYIAGVMVFGPTSAPPPAPVVATGSASVPAEAAQLIAQGQTVYQTNGCTSCHSMNGGGGHSGPDLTHEGSRHPQASWQIAHLKSPTSETANSTMPPYNTLPADQLKALAAFLVTQQ